MNNAVIYARYSSDNQRSASIDAQIRAIEKYAKQNNLTIINNYVDEALSGMSDKRPAFKQMIDDSSKGLFDFVIVHKLDRFSRDRYDSAIYKRKLKLSNVKLLSVVENIDGSPESILMESLLEGLNEYYSKNLAREVMKGLTENALQCKHTGGKPPFGYNVDPITKKYLINKHEEIAVKKIFEMFTNELPYRDIKNWLNKKGYVAKYNNKFSNTSINTLLKNEKYIGTYTYKKTTQTNFFGKRVDVPNDDYIKIKNGIPSIIDERTFKMAGQNVK